MSDNIIQLVIPNPDSASIANKTLVSYTVSTADINYINAVPTVELANSNTFQMITLPLSEDMELTTGTTYYTPVYTEKINYDEWLVTINKNFRELS